jgi:cytochrome c-type biogenesis protein
MEITLPLVLATGLLDSLNPCAISLLLLYIGLLYSMKKSHSTIIAFGAFYISAVYVTYFLIGLGLLRVVDFFNVPFFFAKITAIIAIVFGLLNIKEYFWPGTKFSIRIPMNIRQKASEWAHKATIPAAIVLGCLIALHEFPCSGAVYLVILGYLSKNESLIKGIGYLAIYNFVFVLPLIIIFMAASNRVLTEKMVNWQERMGRKMHLVLAAIMIALGIGIYFWLS